MSAFASQVIKLNLVILKTKFFILDDIVPDTV